MAATPRPHILIVSADPDLAGFLSEGLIVAGFWTSTIASALQVIEVFRLRPFDAVIIDAALPGLGARDLARRLRGVTSRPLLLIADSAGEMTEAETLGLGFALVIAPPIELSDIAVSLARVVFAWREEHPGEGWADELAQRPDSKA